MSEMVTITRQREVAVLLVDNPPVNALSISVRKLFGEALSTLISEKEVKAIVIACAGRTFIAGADIKEFGKPIQKPSLRELNTLLASVEKPTVAAIHGSALGGGLELSLACRFRVARAGSSMGLPEVKLGLIPGAGGTVRLPRLVGAARAADMIVTGNSIDAKEALSFGLVDAVFEGDLIAQAVSFARKKIGQAQEGSHDFRPASDQELAEFNLQAAELLKKTRGLEAPSACVESIRNGLTLPTNEALAREQSLFDHLVKGDQSRAQRHLFFAERAAAKVRGVNKNVKVREIQMVGVIGAGTMGRGIAMSFVNNDIQTIILDTSLELLDRGLKTIEKNYEASEGRGSITEAGRKRRMALLKGSTDYADLAECDLIVEAVFEEMAVKKKVFADVVKVAKADAILATNTSYLDVNQIASVTGRPQHVVGMHFFSPANVMKLVEVVRGSETTPDVLSTVMAVVKRIGKIPVVVGVCHGFVGNRMLSARSAELESLLLEGALPAQIDVVFTKFGWPMGPFRMYDLAGLDIGWRVRKSLGRTATIADQLCRQGRYGQKTGKGYYRYDAGSREAVGDPDVALMIENAARELGIKRRELSDQEIIERTLYPMINEGAKILEEGIVERASDIDLVWVNGYGFPVSKGGPMFWAGSDRLKEIHERLDHWYNVTGRAHFQSVGLLRKAVEAGGTFTSDGFGARDAASVKERFSSNSNENSGTAQ